MKKKLILLAMDLSAGKILTHQNNAPIFHHAMTEPIASLWRQILAAQDAALENEGEMTIVQIDAACLQATILAVRDFLMPGGKPPGPWAIAKYQFWQQLTAEAERAGARE